MTTLDITIKIDRKYGRTLIYPICPKALLFAKLCRQETLTPAQIDDIKALGYTVHVQQLPAIL
jgi:hypothetical protein